MSNFFDREAPIHELPTNHPAEQQLRRGFNRQGPFPPVMCSPSTDEHVLIPRTLTLNVPLSGRRPHVFFPRGREDEEMIKVSELQLRDDSVYVVGQPEKDTFHVEGALLYTQGDLGVHPEQFAQSR